MNWDDYDRLEELELPHVSAAKDRGQARDYRDRLIADGGVAPFDLVRSDDELHAGAERIKRVVANYDWFRRAELDDAAAVRITDAGRRALVNDPHRSYEAIAGHAYRCGATEVRASD